MPTAGPSTSSALAATATSSADCSLSVASSALNLVCHRLGGCAIIASPSRVETTAPGTTRNVAGEQSDGHCALVIEERRGLTMRGFDAGAARTSVAERSRSRGGATFAVSIVTDTALPEQADACLPDSGMILLSGLGIHKPWVLIPPLSRELCHTHNTSPRAELIQAQSTLRARPIARHSMARCC